MNRYRVSLAATSPTDRSGGRTGAKGFAVFRLLRQHFLTGLLTITPLAITLWILWRFYMLIDNTLRPWLQRVPSLRDTYPDFFLTVIGFLSFLLLITLIGLFTRNLIGMALFSLVERLLQRIPVVKSLFTAVKQIAEVFLTDRRSAFKQVVVFEYPRRGIYSLGFVTSDDPAETLLTVFLPTTPNPTSGYLLMVPRAEAVPLPIPIEDGIKLIISGGAVIDTRQREILRATVRKLATTTAPGQIAADTAAQPTAERNRKDTP
jgi:uncharacterized membrane protein